MIAVVRFTRWLIVGVLALGQPTWAHPFDPFAEDKQEAFTLVVEHMRGGEPDEALLQVDDAIRKFPKHGPFYALKAQILLKVGNTAEAYPLADQAIELTDDYPLAYWIRGLLRQLRKDPEGAIADFNRVLELENQNQALMVQAVGSRGMALVDAGRYQAAISDLNRALEARPTAFAERQFRALAYLSSGELTEAATDIEALLKMDPKNSFSHRLAGQLHMARGAWERALEALNQAIALNEKDAAAYRYRALANQKLKRLTAQKADLAKACSLGDNAADCPEKKNGG